MTSVSTTSLPGIYFLPAPVSAGDPLPPLDVAAFVGFAERGPLDRPVALNDYSDYGAVFGGEMSLAQDASGAVLSSYLPASIAAFFSNGGRRCYGVRIAGENASQTQFAIPGMTALDTFGNLSPAQVVAASEGAWASSKLRVAARLQTQPLPAASLSNFLRLGANFTLLWNTQGALDTLLPGELLCLSPQALAQSSPVPAAGSLLLVLADVLPSPNGSSNQRLLIGASLWQVGGGSTVTELPLDILAGQASTLRATRLRFDLVLRETGQPQQTLSDLAFNAPHPRYWGDVVLLESSPLFTGTPAQVANERDAANRYRARRNGLIDLRNGDTLAGTDELAGRLAPLSDSAYSNTYLPLSMPQIVTDTDFVGANPGTGSDDLATFPWSRFLDPWLVGTDAAGLYANAQDRYWVQGTPLTGLHSLMFVDEVAMVALPDLIHPNWAMLAPVAPPPPSPVAPPIPPDLSQFAACPVQTNQATGAQPQNPAPQSATPPVVLPVIQPDTIFSGGGDPVAALVASPLVQVQAELQIFCEARHDLIGILTLPDFYQSQHCQMWLTALRDRLGLPSPTTFASDEYASGLPDLSYVAVYHPWIQITNATAPNRLRALPADGAACGTIAARERARNVWVAPANVPLAGVLGLTPSLSESNQADLFQAGFNIVHAEPRDFRIMSAHTLSGEAIWLQISVRRLLILLRKMLLAEGNTYVFENNSPRFRTAVQMSLEAVLNRLFRGGAFAGKTASQSYRISTGSDVNTPQSLALGQFIVVIQVAPSQPAEFITVQLVRTDDNLLTVAEL